MALVPTAKAQDEAAGRVLFEDAISLLNKGQVAEACPKFEESLRQIYNINAQYYLADCWERQGKTASAWTTFLTVASRAREAGDEKRERAARKRAEGLEKRLVRLRVSVLNEVEGLEIRRDGVLVGRPMWSMAVPVDPGSFEFTATAPGYAPYVASVTAISSGRTVDVTIPELNRKPSPVSTKTSQSRSVIPEPSYESPSSIGESQSKRQGQVVVKRPLEPQAPSKAPEDNQWGTIGWVAGGVGVGAMLTGGIVALLAKRSHDQAVQDLDACSTYACESGAIDKGDSAISRANIGGGLLIGGAALTAAAGVLLIVTSGSNAQESSRSSVSLGISPTGLSLFGRI